MSASGASVPFFVSRSPGFATPTISSARNGSSAIRSSALSMPTIASSMRPASRRRRISPLAAISISTSTSG